MTESVAPLSRISSFVLVIILITAILSISALFFAVDTYLRTNDAINAGYFLLIGFIGLSLSAYMLLQTRRKSRRATLKLPRVITTITCQKCGFKNIRDFQRGDYILKETEPCKKCNENMTISSIYREIQETKKGG